MSFSKDVKFDVKPFKFGELTPNPGSSAETPEVSSYEARSLKELGAFKNNISEEVIRTERGFEKDKSFSILPLVREHRGLKAQEDRDYQTSIEQEVEARVQAAIEQARLDGYRAGHEEGYGKAYQEGMAKLEGRVEDFSDILGNLKDQCHKVLAENKADAFKMIKSLTQWIVLKELEDEAYLERLLNKLILEMNTKNNLVVRVSQESFKYMPEVVEKVQARIGELSNVRVELDMDQEGNGIILESENGIIDASIKSQMASLEKIFTSVGADE